MVLVEQHDVALFEGTLRANLSAGASGRRRGPACRACGPRRPRTCSPRTRTGFDRQLTDGGANLSGGQRQRIGLARALVADPPVLVLHNPTTAVDAVTEGAARRRAGRGPRGGTRGTVLITTSPALLRITDRVVVLDRRPGRRRGPHERLLASDARYREEILR